MGDVPTSEVEVNLSGNPTIPELYCRVQPRHRALEGKSFLSVSA